MCTPLLPENTGNSKIALDIAKDVLLYFKDTGFFNETEKKIEAECDIKKVHGDSWTAEDIKRAWEKAKPMDTTLEDKRHQALAIMMQLFKGWVYDEGKRKAAQTDLEEDVNLEQRFEKMSLEDKQKQKEGEEENKRHNVQGNPVDRSSQDNAEPNKLKAAGTDASSASKPRQLDHVANEDEGVENKSYIRIPLSVLFGDESTSCENIVSNCRPPFKLIDRVPELTTISKKTSYIILYNNQTKNAAWVYEILNKSILDKNYGKRKSVCREDDSIHPINSTPESKKKYGQIYDQGHHAAAGNHMWDEDAYNDTFVLSNISPQCMKLNRGIWRSLEGETRKKALNRNCNVHVYTGPLYLPSSEDSTHVNYEVLGEKSVPTHFFKVIFVEKEDGTVSDLTCYKVPNEPTKLNLEYFKVSVEQIEHDSGLIFTESGLNLRETKKRQVTWRGKDQDGKQTTAEIIVTVSSDS